MADQEHRNLSAKFFFSCFPKFLIDLPLRLIRENPCSSVAKQICRAPLPLSLPDVIFAARADVAQLVEQRFRKP